MGRVPCCSDKLGIKKGPWTPEEDIILISYIQQHGPGNWRAVPVNTGLLRCSKSCRLRWTNYLRPGIKRGNFTLHEEGLIIHLQALLGNKWAAIASHLPQRTDNDIKNYWNTHLKKKKKLNTLEAGLDSHLPSEPEAYQFVSKRLFNHKHVQEKHDPRMTLQQDSSNAVYASSAENISRLLEGWRRSANEQNSVQCYRPQIEKAEFKTSYWDKSRGDISENAEIENNNKNTSQSFFDNLLLYETMAQVEELIQVQPPSIF